jgi:hypothetical protein
MTWRDVLAATGAGLIAAAVALALSVRGELVGEQAGGVIAGLGHIAMHGVTLVAALIGLLLALVVRLDADQPHARLRRLRALRRRRPS